MVGHFDRIRRSPGDDILSALVAVHDEGQGLTDDELTSIAMLLLAAGFETTVNLLGNGVALLVRASGPARRAARRHRVVGDGDGRGAAVRLRRCSAPPGWRTATPRSAASRCAAGSSWCSILGGANRDPAVFADPQRFDVTRRDADRHVAFSQGIHYCLGAGLARMEGEIGLRALFERFPDLALAGPRTAARPACCAGSTRCR